jgi:hypothetical protein
MAGVRIDGLPEAEGTGGLEMAVEDISAPHKRASATFADRTTGCKVGRRHRQPRLHSRFDENPAGGAALARTGWSS